MIKSPSELNYKEKVIINNLIFFFILVAIFILSLKAYFIYQENGFQTCLLETDPIGVEQKLCFNTSKEANEYLQAKLYPKNLDYKYLNEYDNISYVE